MRSYFYPRLKGEKTCPRSHGGVVQKVGPGGVAPTRGPPAGLDAFDLVQAGDDALGKPVGWGGGVVVGWEGSSRSPEQVRNPQALGRGRVEGPWRDPLQGTGGLSPPPTPPPPGRLENGSAVFAGGV